jgi:ketosteroid isomerase-like protein
MDFEQERDRLLQRDAEWAAVASEGNDVERMLSYWTEDARIYPPGLPVVSGKAALRAYVQSALAIPGFHITWTTSDASISPDGQLAYLLSRNAVTLTGPQGRPITAHGRAVTVWRRDPDGVWRCVIDIWNEEPGAPTGAA